MILRRIVKLLACTLLVFTYSCITSTSEIPNTEPSTDPGADPIEETVTSDPGTVDPGADPIEETVTPDPGTVDPGADPIEETVTPDPSTVDPGADPIEETVTPDPGTVDPEVDDKEDELFMSDGDPFVAGPLLTVSTSVSAGTEGAPTDMLIFTPSTEGTYAVIVFSHGFLLANQYYSDTLEHLASHGFIVVAPQTHEAGGLPIGKPSTSEEAATLRAVLSWIPDGLAGLVNVEPEVELVGIAGHSRGAKIGWLALQADPTLGYAIASVDPVNGTGDIFTMNEVSALDKGLPEGMPSLIIGSGLGEESAGLFQPACSPSGQNHVQFFESADSPSWHIVASDAGHLDFIDPSPAGCGFACTACVTGTNIENNLQLSMGTLAAFFRGQLQGDIAVLAFLVDKSSHPANSQVETK